MKRIIVACDGTNQYDVSTNVKRICHALSYSSNGIEQLTFYQSGLGPEDLGSSGFVKAYAQALGEEIDWRIDEAYAFIMNNYLPGDEIFFFGFSRGAFVARVLANFIARVGIYRNPQYAWDFRPALEAYKDGTLDRDIETHQYDTTQDGEWVLKIHRVEIEVVGCWDTVASLGVPWTGSGEVFGGYKHLSPSLVKGIKHAFQALALDEYRNPFSPTLWFLPEDGEVAKTIDLQQCWFPGAHRNIGGGYHDQALADLAFFWILDRCSQFLAFDPKYIKSVVDTHYQPWKLNSNSGRSSRLEHADGYDTVYQGWGRGRCYDSYRGGQTWTWKYRTPGAYRGFDGETNVTNESIHPSVRARWQTSREKGGELKDDPSIYAPKALRGFEPREGANGNWEWVKKENGEEVLVIPEENRNEVLVSLEAPLPIWRDFEPKEVGKGKWEWVSSSSVSRQ
ncbi:hypothetical protein GYMLUDRAFT_249959 [Collybiopsis luxurians FD-317 M1]|uniref:Unplaced genomic scaffold GYMLUscaffold_74, whole genome shotgun sequence n=1 Tax=Collybiopsis luxurians FD-317 M1 TaxID=944289 RepID=A0A0D0BGS5_9AGAR|nr:hypothetical protein GYMLUDRAFT_249959 [Collybiopsis luxurians FD-317 M1]